MKASFRSLPLLCVLSGLLAPIRYSSAQTCAPLADSGPSSPPKDQAADTIYYATNRAASPRGFTDAIGSGMSYGLAVYAYKDIPTPSRYYEGMTGKVRLDGMNTQALSESAFWARLESEMRVTDPCWLRTGFVYVHGFANDFTSTMNTTAELRHRLRYRGVAIVFSWPASETSALLTLPTLSTRYAHDSANADASVNQLREFLDTLVRRLPPRRMNIIAHSMGARVFGDAIPSLAPEAVFASAVFLAPDVSALSFRSAVAPAARAHAKHVAIYVSDKDIALQLSRSRRKGASVAGLLDHGSQLVSGVTTVDASRLTDGFFGLPWLGLNHSLATVQTVLYDLFWEVVRPVAPECRVERNMAVFDAGRLVLLTESQEKRFDVGALTPACRIPRRMVSMPGYIAAEAYPTTR